MESFPRFNRNELDAQEKIWSLKKPILEIFIKLIEQGNTDFDAIVSDDTGARIPTLITSEVLKKLKGKRPKTLFVASGKHYSPSNVTEQTMLESYLNDGTNNAEKVLLVTEYIHHGGTIKRLTQALHNIGVTDITVAALEALETHGIESPSTKLVTSGTFSTAQQKMVEQHQLLSNVAKGRSYSPIPKRLDNAIVEGDVHKSSMVIRDDYDDFEKFVNEIQGDGNTILEEIDKTPLTSEEAATMQQTINFTRKTALEVAKSIVDGLTNQNSYI